jgi:hypothetical protein
MSFTEEQIREIVRDEVQKVAESIYQKLVLNSYHNALELMDECAEKSVVNAITEVIDGELHEFRLV